MALVLHYPPPDYPPPSANSGRDTRPHRWRIARALLDDAAHQVEAKYFPLHCGDVVVLGLESGTAQNLARTLSRLCRGHAPDLDALISLWSLEHDTGPLLAYARARLHDHAALPQREDETPVNSHPTDPIEALISTGRMPDLLQRRTAVLFWPGPSSSMRPLYRKIAFSDALLEARAAAMGLTDIGPSLLGHLASRFDVRLLELLHLDVLAAGPLSSGACDVGPALHVGLSLESVMSAAFTRFATACRTVSARVGVELSLMAACADPLGFAKAREILHVAGFAFVLGGLSPESLKLTNPLSLGAEMIRLDWAPGLSRPEAGAAATTDALGASRIILDQTDTEAALRWGLAQGIRRFQGQHIDAMLGTARLGGCSSAQFCTARQCTERAKATGRGGRAGCRNTTLLDIGTPLPLMRVEAV